MYKCTTCGHLFEDGEQETWQEIHGETFSGCPLCKSDYEEVKPCKICGSYEHEVDEDCCDKCQKDIMKRFNNLIKENFTEQEIEFLKEEQEYGLL
jgi:hypothetical protein